MWVATIICHAFVGMAAIRAPQRRALLALAAFLVPHATHEQGMHRHHDSEAWTRNHGKVAEKFERDTPPETPALPRHEHEWHAPHALQSSKASRPRSRHGPGAPEEVRRRALLEQAYGRAKVQQYMEQRDDISLLDAGRERLRRAIVMAEHFESLRVIAQEAHVLHVQAEAVYALDKRHMKVGRERLYRAHELLTELEPEDTQVTKLTAAERGWTDLGGACVRDSDCGDYSDCVRRFCQPPRFPRPMRLYITQQMKQLEHRLLEHLWDEGMDALDHSAKLWGGNGSLPANVTDAQHAARIRVDLHAGAQDPLLSQNPAVVRALLASAIGGRPATGSSSSPLLSSIDADSPQAR
eukprot:COSAG05_NODE_615_length_8327_cov_6.112543_9_plen_353_part_00